MKSTGNSFTCPDCGRTSHHPMDVLNRYCGACHKFHPEPLAAIVPLDEAFGFAAMGMAAWLRHLEQRGIDHLPTEDLRRDFVAFSDG